MKHKDIDWLNNKIQSIKKRKRSISKYTEPSIKKKIKEDLKKEYRSSKHSEKNSLKEWLKEQINNEDIS